MIYTPSHRKQILTTISLSRDEMIIRTKNRKHQTAMLVSRLVITSFMTTLMTTPQGRGRPPAETAQSHETQMTSPN